MRINDLGIIGNCRSAALISKEGNIVWNCLPDFDSPSVFAKLLDEENGGSFSILPEPGSVSTQSYIDHTNILRTHHTGPSGEFEILDFMPYYHTDEHKCYYAPEIYRILRVLRGSPAVTVKYRPALNFNQNPTRSYLQTRYIKSNTVSGDYHSVYLYSDLPLQDILDEHPLILRENAFFLVSYHQKLVPINLERAEMELGKTRTYWTEWVNRTLTFPKFGNELIRSALTLKLLTYRKTGAVIAAVTTSLPETLGEGRNWDYRFCWVRDASMIIQTLKKINHGFTAGEFLRFLLGNLINKAETLQILYSVRGEKELSEKVVPNLMGYQGSKPVRIGNDAFSQKQNDIYGVLMDLIHLSFTGFSDSLMESEELWTTVRFIMKTVEFNWHKPDRSIWEIRGEHRHFVFSKVLCWMAADRGVRIARMFDRPDYIQPWEELRDAIRTDIEDKGWNSEKRSYTQSYGSFDLDASLLLMEKVGYCSPKDERYISTVRAIHSELGRNGLMYRYRNRDDFGKPSSAFTICAFWMIQALYKIGEKDAAENMFRDLTASANHLGLFSEDMDFDTRELLGNFPQGYSHLELINTVIILNGDNPSVSQNEDKQP